MIIQLANDQPGTLKLNPHPDVTYTLGSGDLAVATTSITVTAPIDPYDKNTLSTQSTVKKL